MLYTPAGNTAVLGFAKQAIAQFKLGDDATPDLLNICLDTPRRISEAYRHQKALVKDTPVDILLIYNSKELIPYSDVFTQVGNILRRVSAKYTSKNKNKE